MTALPNPLPIKVTLVFTTATPLPLPLPDKLRAVFVDMIGLMPADVQLEKLPYSRYGVHVVVNREQACQLMSEACRSGGKFYQLELPFEKMQIRNADFRGYDFTCVETFFLNSDFQGSNFAGANLSDVMMTWGNFKDTNFEGAQLCRSSATEADFERANLQGADLTDAYFDLVSFDSADLRATTVTNTIFRRCLLRCVNVSQVDFSTASLEGARFGNSGLTVEQLRGAANIRGIHIENSDLTGFDFSGLDLGRASFEKSCLQSADFRNATLHRTKFKGADLTQANFQGVDLGSAFLYKATLTNADFRAADLSAVRFMQKFDWSVVISDHKTIWPLTRA